MIYSKGLIDAGRRVPLVGGVVALLLMLAARAAYSTTLSHASTAIPDRKT